MGYEVCILRLKDYDNEEETSNISEEEWLAYIDMDEEMEIDPKNYPGGKWLAHTYEDAPEEHIRLFYYKGTVFTKYPDEETLDK